ENINKRNRKRIQQNYFVRYTRNTATPYLIKSSLDHFGRNYCRNFSNLVEGWVPNRDIQHYRKSDVAYTLPFSISSGVTKSAKARAAVEIIPLLTIFALARTAPNPSP